MSAPGLTARRVCRQRGVLPGAGREGGRVQGEEYLSDARGQRHGRRHSLQGYCPLRTRRRSEPNSKGPCCFGPRVCGTDRKQPRCLDSLRRMRGASCVVCGTSCVVCAWHL
eukprot:1714419-Rhodomonas_salina.1